MITKRHSNLLQPMIPGTIHPLHHQLSLLHPRLTVADPVSSSYLLNPFHHHSLQIPMMESMTASLEKRIMSTTTSSTSSGSPPVDVGGSNSPPIKMMVTNSSNNTHDNNNSIKPSSRPLRSFLIEDILKHSPKPRSQVPESSSSSMVVVSGTTSLSCDSPPPRNHHYHRDRDTHHHTTPASIHHRRNSGSNHHHTTPASIHHRRNSGSNHNRVSSDRDSNASDHILNTNTSHSRSSMVKSPKKEPESTSSTPSPKSSSASSEYNLTSRQSIPMTKLLPETKGKDPNLLCNPLSSLDGKDVVWPAWVYCTRYSDRPSSGKLHFS